MRLNWLFEDSVLAKWLLLFVGLGISGWGLFNFWASKGLGGQIIGLLILVFCGGITGIIVASLVSPIIGQWLGNKVWAPTQKIKRAPERLHYMQGLIEEGKYAEAIAELRKVLARDFLDIDARRLLWRVYVECLDAPDGGIEICREYFDHPAHESTGDSLDLLMYLSDILPAEEAVAYLKSELKRGEYSNYDRKALENRMEALS